MLFRCNLTKCEQYGKNIGFGAILIVNFIKYEIFLADNTIKKSQIVNYLPWNMAQQQTVLSNSTSLTSDPSNIFYTNPSSPSSTYYLSPQQSISILSIFQKMISPSSASETVAHTSFSKYQKYLQFLKQYQNLIIGDQSNISNLSNLTKLITKDNVSKKIIDVINFVRQKYQSLLKDSVILTITQEKTNQNIQNSFAYSVYLLVQTLLNNSLINSADKNLSWSIYKVKVNTRQITSQNIEMRIISMQQFAKNGNLLNSNSSTPSMNRQQTQTSTSSSDIAFGYQKLLLSQLVNDTDIQYVLSFIKSKYSSYFLLPNFSLKSIQKLQLKNGTINYKFIFAYTLLNSSSQNILDGQRQLKIIAVYKKDLKIVEILNKIYFSPSLESQNFRPALDSQKSDKNTIISSCINLIYQIHTSNNLIQKQILPNQRIKILNIQISQKQVSNTSSFNGQTYIISRYRIQFITSQLKNYSTIIEYNPQQNNSFIEIYFSQIVQIIKDSSYRLSLVQQAGLSIYAKLSDQQITDDSFYTIVETKLKIVAPYFCKTLQVMKKTEGFGMSYKIVFLGDSLNLFNNLNGNLTIVPQVQPTLLFETIIYVQSLTSVIQVRQNPIKLDLSNNFNQAISKSIFNESDLNNIASNISSMIGLNLQNNQQMFFSQASMKQFLDGFMMKFNFYVNKTSNKTQNYQMLIFKQNFSISNSAINQPITKIWNIKPTNFSNFQSCSQTNSCTKCDNTAFYTIFNNICFLRIANCLSYSQIDIKNGILKCGICIPGYQLFDQKCIAKQNKANIFIL